LPEKGQISRREGLIIEAGRAKSGVGFSPSHQLGVYGRNVSFPAGYGTLGHSPSWN